MDQQGPIEINQKKNILYRRFLSNPTSMREISYEIIKINYVVLYVPLSETILKRNLKNANRI